jgi:hypothetical protein
VGLREFLQEVLGILRDIKLCPQGEESGHDCLEVLERRVFTISENPKEGIDITGINKGVPDEGRYCQDVGVDSDSVSIKGMQIGVLDGKVGGSGARGRRMLPVAVVVHLVMVVGRREVFGYSSVELFFFFESVLLSGMGFLCSS